jgi:dCMP deaminase
VSVKGGTLYCTTFPCNFCSKAIVNAGVREIVYEEGYPDELSKSILGYTNILIRQLPPRAAPVAPAAAAMEDVPD